MKKFLLFLALALTGAMWNSVDARWELGEQKNASQIHVGDTIVLEFCTQEAFLGRYLAGSKLTALGVLSDDNIYLVEEGPLDVRTGAPTILLKQRETNSYLCYPGAGWKLLTYDPSPEKAANLQVLSCGEDIPWSNCVSWGYETILKPGHEGEEPIASWRNPQSGKVPTDNSVGFSYSPDEKSWTYLGSWNRPEEIWFWQYTDTNEWNVYGVNYISDLQGDLSDLIDLYISEGDVIGGTDPGYYQQDVADEYNEVLQQSLAIVMGSHSDAEVQAAINNLKAAHAKLQKAIIPITEGYYNFVSGFDDFLNNFGVEKAAYANLTAMQLYYKNFDANDAKFMFKVTKAEEDDEYYIEDFLSGCYVGNPTVWYNSATPLTENKETPQNITLYCPGKWYWGSHEFHNTSKTPYASSAPVASDSEGALTTWGTKTDESTKTTHFNLWYLRKVTDETLLAKFEEEKKQATLDATLKELVKSGSELYQNLFAYKTDFDAPLIKRASGGVDEEPADDSQIKFSTLRKQGIATSDKYAFLIDGKDSTYLQGSGYINIKLDEPKQNVTFVYATRGATANGSPNIPKWGMNERPGNVSLYGANTLEGDTVYGNPIISNIDMSEVAPHTVNLGRPVNRIAYQVLSNATGGNYFTLGEFQVYEAKIDEATSQYYTTPGLKAPADALTQIVAAKREIANAGTSTAEDIAELQEAIKAVKTLYADTTELNSLIAESEALINGVETGEGMGQLSDATLIDGLRTAIADARKNAFTTPMSAAAVQAATAAVSEALNAFKAGIKTVEEGKWYFITNLDDKRAGEAAAEDAYCNGNAIYLKDKYSSSSAVKWGLFDKTSGQLNADNNPKAMWRFVPVEGTTYYAIQNMYTGYYLGDYAGDNINLPVSETPIPYDVAYVGKSQFNLIPMGPANRKKFALWPEGAENDVVCHELDGSTSAWTFVEINPAEQEAISISDFAMNCIDVVALPYNYQIAGINDDVMTYAVKKMTQEENESGELVTTVELYEKEEFAAGEPCIIALGNYSDPDAEAEAFDLVIPFPTTVIDHSAPIVSNGIVGGLHTLKFDHATAISNGKAFHKLDAGGGFDAQTGVIDVTTYKGEVEGVETALTLTITGLPEIPTTVAGDVNGDGRIDATDVVTLYNYIASGTESGVSLEAADVNGDGKVDGADVVEVYNIASGSTAQSGAFGKEIVGASEIIPADRNDKALLTISVGSTTDLAKIPVSVILTNPEVEITAVEGCMFSPAGVSSFLYDEDNEDFVYDTTDRWTRSHGNTSFAGTKLHGFDWFFFSIVSNKSLNFKGNDGVIATFYFDGSKLGDGEYEIKLKDAISVWTDKRNTKTYDAKPMSSTFTISGGKATGVEGVEAENGAKAGSAITVDGKAASSLQKGQIYIIDGKKVKF